MRRLSPLDIYSRSTLAEYYFARGELEKAEAFVREARSLRPHDPHIKRAMLDFLKTYGDQLVQQEKFSNAIQYYREALALNPDWVELYHNLALVYANMENWKEAQGVLNTHLARRPQDAESRLVLGDIFWAAGDFSEARVHWRKARKLASGSDPAGVEPPAAQSGARSPHSKVARSMRRRWETQLGDRDSHFPTHSLRRRSLRRGLSRKQLSASLCRELCRINTSRKVCLTFQKKSLDTSQTRSRG